MKSPEGVKPPMPDDFLIDAEQVGERVGVGGRTVLNWWKAGQFIEPAFRAPRVIRWRVGDVNRWVRSRNHDGT